MASNKPDDFPKEIQQDRLVEQLKPDPNEVSPVRPLMGWLGKGTEEGAWRLYLTPQLDEYVQFSHKDIVHTEPVQESQSPLGGTIVWFKAGTVLNHTRVVTRQVQANFLFGEITSRFMAGTVSFPTNTLARRPRTNDFICSVNPHIPVCQVRTEDCPPGGPGDPGSAFCESGHFVVC